MSERDDLLEWMAVWQTDEPIPRDLRDELQRRVLSSQRRWRIATVTEIVIGTIGVLVTVLVAWYATTLTERLAMSSLALVIVGGSVASWRFRRSTAEPAAATTDEWVDFLIRRGRVRERMANAGALMLIVEIGLYIPWIWARAAGHSVVPGFALLTLISAILAVWLFQQRRSARRDIAQLSVLQRELR